MKRFKKLGKRSAAALTALFLCVGLLQTTAFAAYGEDGIWQETVDEAGNPVYDPSGLNKETGEWVAPSGEKWQQILLDWNAAGYGKDDGWFINESVLKVDPNTGAPIYGQNGENVGKVTDVLEGGGQNDNLQNPTHTGVAQYTDGNYYFATFTVTSGALENTLKELEKDNKCEHGNDPDTCPDCNKDDSGDDGDNSTDTPSTPAPGGFDFSGTEVEIDDPDVPLAGLFTRADAIGYLWEQSGSPEWELSDFEDVPADHQWAVAIGWAQDMGIALPDLEGNFRPDDLVERFVEDAELKPEGELEEFLNRYAVYAGIELADDELFIELGGEPDDIVMGEDAQVIFDDFFARLEAALSQAA